MIRGLYLTSLVAVLVALALLASPLRAAPSIVVQGGEVRLFTAASLTDAFAELGPIFETQNPAVRAVFNFGPSSGLRVQIEQGAPTDVFVSADQAQMDQARAAGVIAGEPRTFVLTELVLITPRDNPGRIQSLQDLARAGLRLVTTSPQVPIGAYTRQMLETMSGDPAHGA